MNRDQIFNDDTAEVEPFRFDERVAAVFDDMAVRSIPLYREMQALAASLVAARIDSNAKVLDLGCSTGTALALIQQRVRDASVHYVGVDASGAMLAQCRRKVEAFGTSASVELVEADMRKFPEGKYAVILCLYTLQFLPVEERLDLLSRLRNNLEEGGVLLLAEKVHHDAEEVEIPLTELYYDFKRANGYSELEIARKREALENVLVPQTIREHEKNLNAAGFSRVELVMKWYTFTTWMAFA